VKDEKNMSKNTLAYGIELAGHLPGLQTLLRWWARRYTDGSVVKIRSGYARGMRWRRDRRYVNGYWLGHYELPVQKALTRELKEGDVFYDIGANAGFFALMAARRVGPKGLCVAFDPDPDNCASMHGQKALNDFQNWIIVNEAVSERRGIRRFLRSGAGAATGRLAAVAVDGARPTEVESLEVAATTVDLAAQCWPPPTLVKVDVEGAEAEVLRGAERVLREARPTWLIELHGEDQATAVQTLLSAAGYQLWTLDGAPVRSPIGAPHHVLARPETTR
jgi:FkbM family methyltransferase